MACAHLKAMRAQAYAMLPDGLRREGPREITHNQIRRRVQTPTPELMTAQMVNLVPAA